MLTSIRLQNYKAWRDSGPIRLAPLTVLFGANSAGKSSLPEPLLLLAEAARSPDRTTGLRFVDPRSPSDLRSFDEVVHGRDRGRSIAFELAWTLDSRHEVHDPRPGAIRRGDALAFEASFQSDGHGGATTAGFRYALRDGSTESLAVGLRRRVDGRYALVSSASVVLRAGHDGSLPPPPSFYGFPVETAAIYENPPFTSPFELELERLLRGVRYVGPFRDPPRRVARPSGEAPDHVGVRGEHAIEALLAAGSRTFVLGPGERPRTLPELVAERLRRVGLVDDFEIRSAGDARHEVEVRVRTSPKLPFVGLGDVGVGVSQVLPVFVECFCVPRRSIVVVEQPELHLHPKVQAELADLFVDAIRAREDDEPRGCQFLVESHSEHFLRRLQRRIAEEAIPHDETALYFVDSTEGEAFVRELEVDAFGNIRNWPEGFFGDEMTDLVARSDAQARRTRAGAPR